ncbi:MAG TPA: hypothetical protein VHX38_13480 [Pseudonocardiaceae bacterium]|nr:hypothetical protein [Pseudonocardiaceae bacterium]
MARPKASSTPSYPDEFTEDFSGSFSGSFATEADHGYADEGYYDEPANDGPGHANSHDHRDDYADEDDADDADDADDYDYADDYTDDGVDDDYDYADDGVDDGREGGPGAVGPTSLDSMLSSADESDESGGGSARRRRPAWGGWALLVVFVLLAAAGGVWLHDVVTKPPQQEASGPPPFTIEILGPAPGSAIPSASALVPADVPGPHDPQVAWVNRIAAETDIPQLALSAYVNAQTVMAQRDPGCHLSWATLAGVGWVESDHGRYGGDSIGPDDREVQPMIGPALDGTDDMRKVPDTDHGALDGDPVWDHAVGPMQFLPATWLEYGLRASNDGKAPDPQNFADAALTAGRYLCVSGGDLSIPKNWWSALYVYNNSPSYGQQVFSGADAYAQATH